MRDVNNRREKRKKDSGNKHGGKRKAMGTERIAEVGESSTGPSSLWHTSRLVQGGVERADRGGRQWEDFERAEAVL